MNCNNKILTEIWLNSDVPNSAIELTGRYVFWADRIAVDSGKTRVGGLCIYVNKTWCRDTTSIGSHCSANLNDLMVKCRPAFIVAGDINHSSLMTELTKYSPTCLLPHQRRQDAGPCLHKHGRCLQSCPPPSPWTIWPPLTVPTA